MLSLKLLLAAGLIAALVKVVLKFDAHCDRKFHYRFFTGQAYFFTIFADILLLFGVSVWQTAVAYHGHALNELVVTALGIGVLGWLFYRNIAIFAKRIYDTRCSVRYCKSCYSP